MKLIVIVAPLALLAACSQPAAIAPPEPVQMSAEARSEMARINGANFAPAATTAPEPQMVITEGAPAPATTEQIAAPGPAGAAPEATVAPSVQYNAALVRIEVMLDRAHFSPGVIDGFDGENVRKAVTAYQEAHQLDVNGQADDALLQTLTQQDAAPALVSYVIAADDVRGPFAPVPQDLEAMSHLDHLGYASAAEGIAEKFHMDEDLLRKLNPGVDFASAGAEIVVANAGGDLGGQVASIVIDKRARTLRAFDGAGQLLAFYPASIGSPEAPAPSGDYAVRAVAMNPTYHYDPSRLPTFGHRDHGALTIQSGPNNPVGAVWIALTLDTYGIHGAPQPQQVSKTQSHGCVRLTNWDATELGHAVHAGTSVSFRDGETVASR